MLLEAELAVTAKASGGEGTRVLRGGSVQP